MCKRCCPLAPAATTNRPKRRHIYLVPVPMHFYFLDFMYSVTAGEKSGGQDGTPVKGAHGYATSLLYVAISRGRS